MSPFISIHSYRLPYRDVCELANPDAAAAFMHAATRVDSLPLYTTEMWGVLTDVVLREWFGIRLLPAKMPSSGPIHLPNHARLLHCLDRQAARQIKADVDSRYFARQRGAGSMSIFAGYGLAILEELERERDGLSFLARQANHFLAVDDCVLIVENHDETN